MNMNQMYITGMAQVFPHRNAKSANIFFINSVNPTLGDSLKLDEKVH